MGGGSGGFFTSSGVDGAKPVAGLLEKNPNPEIAPEVARRMTQAKTDVDEFRAVRSATLTFSST